MILFDVLNLYTDILQKSIHQIIQNFVLIVCLYVTFRLHTCDT